MTNYNSPEYMRKLLESVKLDEFMGVGGRARDHKWFVRIEYKDGTIDDHRGGPYDTEEEARERKMQIAMEHDHDRTSHMLKRIRVLRRRPDWLEIPAPERH